MKIPYGKHRILEEDINCVVDVLKSEYITCGPKIEEFENFIADMHDAKYAVAFCNGTAALHASYYALGVTDGDEIITTPITFAATANAAIYCGGKPVFADISMETYCLDPVSVENCINSNTKVITPVAFSGYPVELKAFREIADKNNCKILYDAAHGVGSRRDGSFGMEYIDVAILSFHPVKHIACGEGGMVLTNDIDVYEKLKLFRTHGIVKNISMKDTYEGDWAYDMVDLGYNYRMSDILAALGISQAKRLEENIKDRNSIADRYFEAFEHIDGIVLPPHVKGNNRHAYHLFVIRTESEERRKQLYDYLHKEGIMVQVHYIPIYKFSYYKKTFSYDNEYMNAEEYYKTCLSLPMYHGMEKETQEYVINKVLEFFGK